MYFVADLHLAAGCTIRFHSFFLLEINENPVSKKIDLMYEVCKRVLESVTRLACCQSLLVNQINCTLTNFADHCDAFSPDAGRRSLSDLRRHGAKAWIQSNHIGCAILVWAHPITKRRWTGGRCWKLVASLRWRG